MSLLRLLLLLPAALASGCASIGYYAQAAGGQLDLLGRARPIAELLGDASAPGDDMRPPPPPASPELKARLTRIVQMRDFATHALALPDNGSYRSYADLGRPAVAWNVVATPEFSLEPKEWCFPIAGCVPYRGYFEHKRALRFARELKEEGLDVRVAPVAAYSTLGWFRDPVLSTQLRRSDTEIAAVMFHELAHQRLYLPGDAAFNESFATTVEIEGLRRWLAQEKDTVALDAWLADKARETEFVTLVLEYRARLAALYATSLADSEKRARKAEIFAQLRGAAAELRARWHGYAGYDAWFAQDLNNAHLASVGLYHQYVPAFQELLQRVHGDLGAFYRAARALSRLPVAERSAHLEALGQAQVAAVR